MKSMRILATAGLLAAVTAGPASAWSGDLVRCLPTAGQAVDVTFKKGLSCKDSLNKLAITLKADPESPGLNQPLDNCVANSAAPWNAWVAGKWGKMSAADAATISTASLKLKGSTFGSCNFSGSDTSAGANGAGSITFSNAIGEKVKGASLKFFGTVAGDAATYSASAIGLVTKGLGLGADIDINVGLNIGAPENGVLLACNTGGVCTDPNDPNDPANLAPVALLKLITGPVGPIPQSYLLISSGEPDPNDPNDDYSAIP
jgi:hypothetical protein